MGLGSILKSAKYIAGDAFSDKTKGSDCNKNERTEDCGAKNFLFNSPFQIPPSLDGITNSQWQSKLAPFLVVAMTSVFHVVARASEYLLATRMSQEKEQGLR